MNHVDALGPDAPATALGQRNKIPRAGVNGGANILVFQKQSLQRLASRIPRNGSADGDANVLTGLQINGHRLPFNANQMGRGLYQKANNLQRRHKNWVIQKLAIRSIMLQFHCLTACRLRNMHVEKCDKWDEMGRFWGCLQIAKSCDRDANHLWIMTYIRSIYSSGYFIP